MSSIFVGRTSDEARGAAAALLAGTVTVLLVRDTEPLPALLSEPDIVIIGFGVACGLGWALARKAARTGRMGAVALAIGYGLLVPALVAGLIALPVAPIAVAFSYAAWPITIPAAFGWLVLLRCRRTRERLSSAGRTGMVVVLATALLVLRFTQPATSVSAAGASCISFPGEAIAAIAWSPDGQWLGLGSNGTAAMIIRVVEQDSGRIIELARGPDITVESAGIAVGPGGEVTYLVDHLDAETGASSLWTSSPIEAARLVVELPTPAIGELTWTADGIAAVLWVAPTTLTETHRVVWARSGRLRSSALEPVAPEALLRNPILAPLVPVGFRDPLTIQTPSGLREVPWPADASDEISVTRDGAFIVYPARALTPDMSDEEYNHVVARSTETGSQVVLAEADAWSAQYAAGKLAYLTFPWSGNSVCVKSVRLEP